jgi:hypothetical protein
MGDCTPEFIISEAVTVAIHHFMWYWRYICSERYTVAGEGQFMDNEFRSIFIAMPAMN